MGKKKVQSMEGENIVITSAKYVEADDFYPRFTLPEIEIENDFNVIGSLEQCIISFRNLTAKEEMSHLRRLRSLVAYRIQVTEHRVGDEKREAYAKTRKEKRERRKHE